MARIIRNETELLKVCYHNLSPSQLLYLKLYYFEGLTMRQIAKECKVNPSTVSRGIKRGLTTLQKHECIILKDFGV